MVGINAGHLSSCLSECPALIRLLPWEDQPPLRVWLAVIDLNLTDMPYPSFNVVVSFQA